jgi:hypothetical protein
VCTNELKHLLFIVVIVTYLGHLSFWKIIHLYYLFYRADLSSRVFTHLFRVSLASRIFYSSQRLHMEVNTSCNYHNINQIKIVISICPTNEKKNVFKVYKLLNIFFFSKN